MSDTPIAAQYMPDMIDFLSRRRSTKPVAMTGPGPDAAVLDTLLKIAARVPDHGKQAPWRFIIIADDARVALGQHLRTIIQDDTPDAEPAKLELEEKRFLRAPVVVAVISAPVVGKIPEWEQILSVGAVCYNLCLAANAHGFASCWITEWMAYHPDFHAVLGMKAGEKIAGFIYLGTAATPPEERDRPDMSRIVTRWQAG
jgi:nitroreductase